MPEVRCIDLNYLGTPQAIAVYVMEAVDGPILFETGPGSTIPALEAGLRELGVAPQDVKRVFVTHIHLDHAGAAWWLARHGALIHVHEFGAGHLIDPARLLDSARRIYRDRMDRMWGELHPIPATQVVPMHDGDRIDIGGMRVSAVATPGHARHHHAFVVEDDAGRIAFTGDVAATFIAESPGFISLPTPPPEFDLDQWLASIDRLESLQFDRIYPTHFGVVENVVDHLSNVREALRKHVARVAGLHSEGLAREEVLRQYAAWFFECAERCRVPREKRPFYVTNSLMDMNVTGILRWLTPRPAPAPAPES